MIIEKKVGGPLWPPWPSGTAALSLLRVLEGADYRMWYLKKRLRPSGLNLTDAADERRLLLLSLSICVCVCVGAHACVCQPLHLCTPFTSSNLSAVAFHISRAVLLEHMLFVALLCASCLQALALDCFKLKCMTVDEVEKRGREKKKTKPAAARSHTHTHTHWSYPLPTFIELLSSPSPIN